MDKADRIRERHVKSFTMKTLSEHIHIRTGRSKYTGDTVLAVLVWTAMCHEFVEGVARNLLNIWRMVVPSGDTVRRWIECLTPGDVRSSLLSCNSDVLEKAISMPSHTSGCVFAGLQRQGILRKEDIRTHCRRKAQERHELVLQDCDTLRCGEGHQV
jgi:hypothetical protein